MKTFTQFIGESREESSRPQLDEILSRLDRPTSIIDWLESNLGSDFLEFSVDSPVGEKIAQEFQPRGFVSSRTTGYRSFLAAKGGFDFYYYTGSDRIKPLAVRTKDSSTWWISRDSLASIDPSWAIDLLFADF